MASAPPDTTFRKEDFPETGLGDKDSLDRLFLPLNKFLSATRLALNGGLTMSENLNAEVKTFNLTTPAAGTGVLSCFPAKLSTKLRNPVGALLLSVMDLSASPGVPSLGCPSFTKNPDGTLQLTNIPGLLLGRTYTVTLLILGG